MNADVEHLDTHLGRSEQDPRDGEIPRANGQVRQRSTAWLGEWPAGVPARIVHIEDDRPAACRKMLAAGLRPSTVVRVRRATTDSLEVEASGTVSRIDRAVAAGVRVESVQGEAARGQDSVCLTDLASGEWGQVLGLEPACQGLVRRRLMDLGVTPGVRVQAALDNTFGDPRAFRIRGTTIALRRKQSRQIQIRPLRAASMPGPPEAS